MCRHRPRVPTRSADERRRHVDTARIVVCRLEGDVLGPEVRADTFEEEAQRDAGPTANIAPSLDADMLDDDRGLRQRLKSDNGQARLSATSPDTSRRHVAPFTGLTSITS